MSACCGGGDGLSYKLSEAIASYKQWVETNPGLVTDCETVLKWSSYILSGYVRNSAVLSELIFSSANLITFLNDRILSGKFDLKDHQYSRLENILSVLEMLEVFLEMAGLRFGGPAARWAVIVAVQVLKTVVRLVIFSQHSGVMMVRPLVTALDRSVLSQPQPQSQPPSPSPAGSSNVTLKRSGRTIRKIEGAPPTTARDWIFPPSHLQAQAASGNNSLQGKRRVAELLHILQPLAHLSSLAVFGENSWKPLILSLVLDCSSLSLHSQAANLDERERRELMRRRLALIHYLLRSPLYDRKSKAVIVGVLRFLQDRVPLVGSVAGAALKYLPEYQQVYFYVWS